MTDNPSFTCPDCGRTSHDPHDSTEQYCGHCHEFKGNLPEWEVYYTRTFAWHDVIRTRTPMDASIILGNRIRAGEPHHSEPEQDVSAVPYNGTRQLGTTATIGPRKDPPGPPPNDTSN